MISLERLKEIEPKLKDKSDEELVKIRDLLYGLAKLSLESYLEDKSGSNFPVGMYGLNSEDM
ncbi:hypothetical protein IT399_02780 [Candidatus Nomurabacteria bacterium]|nr:hypothetical protein [Candidatus Nomurabacteria bacterium]